MPPKKTTRKPAAAAPATKDDAASPMTPAQVDRLRSLSQRAGDPDAFSATLTRGQARQRIAALEALLDREAHGGVERFPRT